jgi:DNA invertase Pin-like site-specific DNA recombinase
MENLFGYARVSTEEQNLEPQLLALKKAGCAEERIFVDKVSGVKSSRPGLDQCLRRLQSGDTLVVWRLDRLGRSMAHLVNLIEELKERGVGFKSLCDGAIDTTTASGELIFNIFSSLAQFERRLIQERTAAGLLAARARGKVGGRRQIDAFDPRVQTAKRMRAGQKLKPAAICRKLKISRSTLYRWLNLSSARGGRGG